MTIHGHVAAARHRLRASGISPTESDLDARLLAQHALGWTTERFLSEAQDAEPDGFVSRYDSLVSRRAGREPLAYIVGTREFWGLDFEVTPAVLIPRPSTELIVEAILERFPDRHGALIDCRRLHRVRLCGGRHRARAYRPRASSPPTSRATP